jgi:hypothetical protein
VTTLDGAVPYEPPTSSLRASDADREATVERLRVAAAEGRLDTDEFDERLTAAYSARWCAELERLTVDVTPPPAPPERLVFVQRETRTNGLAIASLVAGILWMWWLGSFAAVIMGHVALNQIARSGGRQTGRGLAITGLVLGYFGVAACLLILVGFLT